MARFVAFFTLFHLSLTFFFDRTFPLKACKARSLDLTSGIKMVNSELLYT